jgi:hypothetical protein
MLGCRRLSVVQKILGCYHLSAGSSSSPPQCLNTASSLSFASSSKMYFLAALYVSTALAQWKYENARCSRSLACLAALGEGESLLQM